MKPISSRRWHARFTLNQRLLSRGRTPSRRRVVLCLESLESRVVPTALLSTFIDTATNTETPVQTLVPVEGEQSPVAIVSHWDITSVMQIVHETNNFTYQGVQVPQKVYDPVDGNSSFTLLKTGAPSAATTYSQTFTVGAGGQRIFFSAFFDAGDYNPVNDYGDIVLYKDSTPLVTLFASNISGGSSPALLAPTVTGATVRNGVGSFGSTSWTPIQYDIAAPGTYTVMAVAANTHDNFNDSFLGVDKVQLLGTVLPTINVGDPLTVKAGDPVSTNITFTSQLVNNWWIEIDSGSGQFHTFTGNLFISGTPGGTNSFAFQDMYEAPGTYRVTFRVHVGAYPNPGVSQDASLIVNVFKAAELANLDQTATDTITDPSKGATVQTTGTANDSSSTQVGATLTGTAGASVFAGTYKADPTSSQTTINGHDLIKVGSDSSSSVVPTAYFDLRAAGVDANASLTSTFTVQIDPSLNVDDIKVYYNDGTNWLPVQPDSATTRTIRRDSSGKVILDPVTGKETVDVQVTYTKDTSPSIFDLHGTVFTVALPTVEGPPTTTPVIVPVATLNALPPATTVTTSFSRDSGGTFVLRVSQGTDLSASRTEASSSGPVTGAVSTTEPSPDQLIKAAVDNNWFLRAVLQPVEEDANPIRPAAGEDQNSRPVQPATPQNQNDTSGDSVQAMALDTMFAKLSHEGSDMPVGSFCLLVPTPATQVSPLNAGWALVAAAIGAGPISIPEKRKRKAKRVKL